MAKAKAAQIETEPTVEIKPLARGTITVAIKGTTPIIFNRMSSKVGMELLIPKGRKTAAQKQSTLKHNPYLEFKNSIHSNDNPEAPTLLEMPATAFKQAMRGAAVDVPNITKAEVGRSVYVTGENSVDRVSIYGTPKLLMSYVRMADISRTPDVRSRAIVERWVAVMKINFNKSKYNEACMVNLLATAGMIQGVGEWRPEKGSGSYGQFDVVGVTDAEFKAIVKSGGRAAQLEAMNAFEPYDDETRALLEHWDSEIKSRGNDLGSLKTPFALAS